VEGEKYENKTHSEKKQRISMCYGSLLIGQKNVEIVSVEDTS